MRENKKLFLGDLAMLLFLVYMYLWRIGPWYFMHRVMLSLYFLSISILFYLLLYKVLRLNHWASLLGALVFSFCGSDLSLAFNHKIPYPGLLPIFVCCFSFCVIEKKKRLIYLLAIIMFLLASISVIMRFPVILSSSIRLFFNLFAGIIVGYGFNAILYLSSSKETPYCYRKMQNLLCKVWLFTLLIILPVTYALLVFFVEISKQLIPNIVNQLVMFEIFLGWTLIISDTRCKVISSIIPFITIFLVAADIFNYWVVNIQ